MGKWFGQASEIEELRAENRQLKEQVANLEARLRAAYADAGVTALAGSSFPAPEAAVPTPVPATSGLDLKTSKAAIDAARRASANR